ncbi:uncharacterized protein LOC127734715 [Mytilus californianus]|uniref:uncharacterized protein LOC127734715 n=1 Tax=Mytilus californianus TaxID=6549 RepID=UPI002247AFA6|nr:uncharacterized protein LOC127734715 [Mytilus californianus]
MKGILVTFIIIHVILVDTLLSLSESDSCDGEHCSEVISMPIIDDMRATLKADLDVSKMNKHLKAYIQQEIEKGVKTAMENLMKHMIENSTDKMNAEITTKFKEVEERQSLKTDETEQLIKNKTEKMKTEIRTLYEKMKTETMTMFEKTNTEITVKSIEVGKRQTTKTYQMEQIIKNKTEEILTFFKDNEEIQAIKTDKMEQLMKNKTEEMLTLFKDNNKKIETRFNIKIEEFEQKFEVKDRFKHAFFSHLSSDKRNFNQDTILVFDVVPLNIGSTYNGTTGKFTCKEDGIYTFSWATNEGFTSALVVDGKPIASNINAVHTTFFGDYYVTGSISVIVDMTKGQESWINIEQLGDYLTESWSENTTSSVFSGFRI